MEPKLRRTPGRTYYGEHTTSVNGKGKDITDEDMLKVAINNKIDLSKYDVLVNTGLEGSSFQGDYYWKNETLLRKINREYM